jgi:hypothetical protein
MKTLSISLKYRLEHLLKPSLSSQILDLAISGFTQAPAKTLCALNMTPTMLRHHQPTLLMVRNSPSPTDQEILQDMSQETLLPWEISLPLTLDSEKSCPLQELLSMHLKCQES